MSVKLAPDLHTHSSFSMLDGMGSPEAVVKRAKELGWGAAALTEHGWLGSTPLFYQACKAEGIKPIIGCEIYVVPDVEIKEKGEKRFHLTVLALSVEGYHNLVKWVTFAMQRENYYYNPRISPELMAEIAPYPLHHNVVLSGCLGSELNQTLLKSNGSGIPLACVYVEAMRSIFPNFYLELADHSKQKFLGLGESYDRMIEQEGMIRTVLLELHELTGTPIVVTNDSHFQSIAQRKAHLAMVSSNRHRGDSHYGISAERKLQEFLPHYAYWMNYMRPMEAIADGLPAKYREVAIENVLEIVEEADIRLDPLDIFNYSIPFSGYENPIAQIRARSKRRLAQLVSRHGEGARDRFEHELAAMGDFAHYLLTMSDFLRYARRQGILTNSRGSAANSIVCYCLEIHDIDSIRWGLVFERFYNPSRKKLPDIDIDIEYDRYDDFMRYVKERMTELEGEGSVVQICNLGTLANRSAFRMVADSLGISKEEQDDITKLLPQMIDSGVVDKDTDVYSALKEQYPEIYDLVSTVFDGIRQVSQHACGWLFGTKDRPIEQWIPLYLIASSGTMVTQYDLKSLDAFGLVKGDFLRLKTLSVVKRTLNLIGQSELDLSQIPLDDDVTFEMLRQGKTEGVFTLQGKENRRGVMEVDAKNVHDVIASVAIYRPALTRPGYDKVYNKRRRGFEDVEYPCEIAEKVLGSTYGIPIFQEQILELGYALGMDHREVEEFLQAIKMAKGVGRGAKEAFSKIRPMYDAHAKKLLTKDEANALWNLIDKFQGYGFNKGHATSYGILALQSAYLKANFPQHFYTALLDVYPEKLRYIASARAEGFRFSAPSCNQSGRGFSLGDKSTNIRVGLARIRGLGPVAIEAIVGGQPFASFSDFKERIPARAVSKPRIEALAALGAFSDLGIRGDADDLLELQLLGFTLGRPKMLKGIKPKHVRPWQSAKHRFLGYTRAADMAEAYCSVAKLFWIPNLSDKEILEKKASTWALTKTTLLKCVDVNGIPFQLMVNEDRPEDVAILEFLAKHFRDSAVCVSGAVRQPFLQEGPMGYRYYGVTGARESDPQVWNYKSEKHRLALIELCHRAQRAFQARRAENE